MIRRAARRAPILVGFVSALLSTPHCTLERGSLEEERGAAPAGVVLSAGTWTVEWDAYGLTLDPEGGWSVTTNLGYRVQVDRGFHVAHNLSFVPCPAEAPSSASLFDLTIRSARAHEEEMDPSMIEALFVSDLARPRTVEIAANSFAPARYCQVYFLFARGMEGNTSADGLDLSNRTVFLAGTWERDGASGALGIDTWWPGGRFVDLESVVSPSTFAAAAEDSAVRFAWVTLKSPLRRVFDDIDFASDTEALMEDRILDNLTEGMEVHVELDAP